ncbi:MAG TPA: TauD/TfdA family dioxygenase [Hyphomicrobiales bacterium]|jgi:hypothetical protein
MMRCYLDRADYNLIEAWYVFNSELLEVEKSTIVHQIESFGFVVIDLKYLRTSQANRIKYVENIFNLGEPYIPRLYRNRTEYKYVDVANKETGTHPAFTTSNDLAFHVDGLLEPIGHIRTSILYCISPATYGGRTQILNSTGIFLYLSAIDKDVASVLMEEDILLRRSTLPDVSEQSVGPAFQFDEARGVICRYSDGETEVWSPNATNREIFATAIAFFRTRSKDDNRWRISVQLKEDQCLILRNDKVSHGREAFVDEGKNRRHMIRSVYLGEVT